MAEAAAAVQESAGSASASTGEGGVAGGEVAKVTGSDWYIGLPDDLRNDKTVVGFKDKALPEVIKNWKEAQS